MPSDTYMLRKQINHLTTNLSENSFKFTVFETTRKTINSECIILKSTFYFSAIQWCYRLLFGNSKCSI